MNDITNQQKVHMEDFGSSNLAGDSSQNVFRI